MAAHHVDVGAGAAGADVAEVHDADDLLHVVIGPEIGAPACLQHVWLSPRLPSGAVTLQRVSVNQAVLHL